MVAGIDKPVVVIVGPTASGKTSSAIDLALKLDGEIICADSRTVFKEMDIGTAKPSEEEQVIVKHWGVDLTDPGQRFTAAEFQRYANKKIVEIQRRNKIPIVVGGTGLYVDGLIFNYDYPSEPSVEHRRNLEQADQKSLYEYCVKNNIQLPINDKNKRHLARSIVQKGVPQQRGNVPKPNTIICGIAVERTTLNERIALRTEQMFENGVVDEATRLGKKYGWESEAMTASIYPLAHDYLKGSISIEDMKAAFCARDRQLAKRQMTWFRRNSHISWSLQKDIADYVVARVAPEH